MSEIPDEICHDLVVVGGGVSGLIACRTIKRLRPDLNVILIEAKTNVGGRFSSSRLAETLPIVDLGNEHIDEKRHPITMSEISYYRLETETIQRRLCWVLGSKIMAQCPVMAPEFCRVFALLDADSERLNFLRGYEQIDDDNLDISYMEYVNKRLETSGPPRDFLLSAAYMIFGSEPDTLSAMQVLWYIRGFRSSEIAMRPPDLILSGGIGSLVSAIEAEVIHMGVEIVRCTPVTQIRSESNHIRLCSADGRKYTSRSVILAIPLSCLPSIRVSPSLPPELLTVAEQGNCRNNCKVWVLARGASRNVDQVVAWPGCVTSYIKLRYESSLDFDNVTGRMSSFSPWTAATSSMFTFHDECAASEKKDESAEIDCCITGKPGIEVAEYSSAPLQSTCGLSLSGFSRPSTSSSESGGALQKSPSRPGTSDRLPALRASVSVSSELGLTRLLRSPSRQSTHSSPLSRAASPITRPITRPSSVASIRTTTKRGEVTLIGAIGRKSDLRKEALEQSLHKHHPTIQLIKSFMVDFSSSPWSRAGHFALKKGFGKLHSVACRQAKQPWIHSKALVIAGSDVALGSWIGCLEGALVDGEVAALKILNEVLFPVKPPKNFMKQIRDINHI